VFHGRKIAVIGLGYVGLAVAAAFARSGSPVIGFDIDADRVAKLREGIDPAGEVDAADLVRPNLAFYSTPAELHAADFYIVTVPTPVGPNHRPNLSILLQASELVGRWISRGNIVVFESTVYPGATEEDCIPVIERVSGLAAGRDFTVGYSPERVNAGDPAHRFETIEKIIAAQDAETLEIISAVYGSAVSRLYRAPSIKVAEAAKLIENVQRDVNIAVMNDISAFCHALDIDTLDVISAARSKWNFCHFTPGLVGGHCIGAASYYLIDRAEKAGFSPETILSGRQINESLGNRLARECIHRLRKSGNAVGRITILGLAFKEDVSEVRNSKVVDIVRGLQSAGLAVQVHDALVRPEDSAREHGIATTEESALLPADAVILAVPHSSYLADGWPMIVRLLKDGRGLVMDVKGKLDRAATPDGVDLWRL
jgi:UDP-N-acetyl-D-glucosamine/UDP-N-acetyl-D-galactosamine dehydrogenase